MSIALVTDSNAQLPPTLVERYGIGVVAIPVVIDGVEHHEGVDLDADRFYEFFESGTPDVSTSQPSPGAFVSAYEQAAEAGHDHIVSIHVGETYSGALNSARLAADLVDIGVTLVDSRTVSFGIGCCVWKAAILLEAGAAVPAVVEAVDTLTSQIRSVTALGAAELLHASGRVRFEESGQGVDVYLAGPDGSFDSVGAGRSVDEVCDLMADTMRCDGSPIRVAIGIADRTAEPYWTGLEQRLDTRPDVTEIVRYRIGPSVGAFTGPGTAGGFWYPA